MTTNIFKSIIELVKNSFHGALYSTCLGFYLPLLCHIMSLKWQEESKEMILVRHSNFELKNSDTSPDERIDGSYYRRKKSQVLCYGPM